MREIQSGDIVMRIGATALTGLLFKQDFNADIMKTLATMLQGALEKGEVQGEELNIAESDILAIVPDFYSFLQVLYAMNKTQNQAENLKTDPFDKWVERYQHINILDVFGDVVEEAVAGFFRTTK